MGDISTVLWYRGLLQSLWSAGAPRDWGRTVGGLPGWRHRGTKEDTESARGWQR